MKIFNQFYFLTHMFILILNLDAIADEHIFLIKHITS